MRAFGPAGLEHYGAVQGYRGRSLEDASLGLTVTYFTLILTLIAVSYPGSGGTSGAKEDSSSPFICTER